MRRALGLVPLLVLSAAATGRAEQLRCDESAVGCREVWAEKLANFKYEEALLALSTWKKAEPGNKLLLVLEARTLLQRFIHEDDSEPGKRQVWLGTAIELMRKNCTLEMGESNCDSERKIADAQWKESGYPTITVTSDPLQAQVTLVGEGQSATTPATLILTDQSHQLRLDKQGYHSELRPIPRGLNHADVTYTLVPERDTATVRWRAPESGKLTCKRGDDIYRTDEILGQGDVEVGVEPGEYRIIFAPRVGTPERDALVTLAAREDKTVDLKVAPPLVVPPSHRLDYVLMGVGMGVAIGGALAVRHGLSLRDDVDELRRRASSGEYTARVVNGTYGDALVWYWGGYAGIGVGVGTAAFGLWRRFRGSGAKVSWIPETSGGSFSWEL